MALNWLGQLNPTMQQQIALQRALLALQREDEQIRMKTMPQPALTRGLQGGGGTTPTPYAGPTSTLAAEEPSPLASGALATPHFRPGAGSLEEALRAAQPSPEGVPTAQTAAWARRKELAEERVVSAKEAYDRIVALDPAGQKVALAALRKYKSDVYNSMEREGYLSPAGELVQPKQDIFAKESYVSEGWIHERTTFADGTTTDETIAPAPEEAEEAPSVSDMVALERLGLDIKKFDAEDMKTALKYAGDIPKEGIDMITDENGDTHPATPEDVDNAMQGVVRIYNLIRAQKGVREVATEGEATMSNVEQEFSASSSEGKMAIQAKLGVPQTGEWDEATAFAMETYGEILLGEKEPVKKPERESNMITGGGLSGL